MKLATYNIRNWNFGDSGNNYWQKRKYGIKHIIESNDVDIVGLQEVTPIFQSSSLKSLFPQYNYIGCSAGFFAENLAIIYKNRTLLDSGKFTISKNRICMWAKFEDCYVFNTHFDFSREDKTNSAKIIVEKIKEINNEGFPIVLMGDLNVSFTNENDIYNLLADIFDDANVKSTLIINGSIGTAAGFKSEPPTLDRRIDYIFTKGFKNLICETNTYLYNGVFPSDHLPIIAKIE